MTCLMNFSSYSSLNITSPLIETTKARSFLTNENKHQAHGSSVLKRTGSTVVLFANALSQSSLICNQAVNTHLGDQDNYTVMLGADGCRPQSFAG